MESSALVIFAVVGLVLVMSVTSEPFIEAQDASMEKDPVQTNMKRYHNGCYARHCYYYRCPQGYYCYNNYYCCRRSYPQYPYCSSQSNCKASQCCAKHYQQQQTGVCKDLKKAGEWCPVKPDGYHCGCVQGYECRRYRNSYYWGKCTKACSSDASCQMMYCCSGGQCKPQKKANEYCPFKGPDHYHCGCVQGFECRRYRNSYYWGKCSCYSDTSCQKTHCCSGGQCKPKKKANGYCPLKGADIYHCGCVEGYECKSANVGSYWGKCLEESGSGLGENMVS